MCSEVILLPLSDGAMILGHRKPEMLCFKNMFEPYWFFVFTDVFSDILMLVGGSKSARGPIGLVFVVVNYGGF